MTETVLSFPFDFTDFADRYQEVIIGSDDPEVCQVAIFEYLNKTFGWQRDLTLRAMPRIGRVHIHFENEQQALLWKLANV